MAKKDGKARQSRAKGTTGMQKTAKKQQTLVQEGDEGEPNIFELVTLVDIVIDTDKVVNKLEPWISVVVHSLTIPSSQSTTMRA